MASEMKCPHCGQAWDLTPEQQAQYVNQAVTCTNCQRPFVVGAGGQTTGAPPPPPVPPAAAGPMGYASPMYYRPQTTSGLAIAALVFACIGIFLPLVGLVGVVLGIIALTRMRDPAVGGKGLAIAGICVGAASVLMSACMLSILLPSLNRARETANRVKCSSNLRQVGQAMLLYSMENSGAFPPTPDLLVLTQDIEPVAFICPSSNDSDGSAGLTTRAALAGSIMKPGQNSYVYVAGGLTSGAPAQAVLAYEPLTNHDGDGGNFLFGDGHVEFLPKTKANAYIAEISAGHNPPRPSVVRGK